MAKLMRHCRYGKPLKFIEKGMGCHRVCGCGSRHHPSAALRMFHARVFGVEASTCRDTGGFLGGGHIGAEFLCQLQAMHA